MSKIPESLYKDIVKSVPIICIDLCIACHENGIKNGYLLVKRKQEPLLGDLWVPGGRVFQNETLLDAAQRKLKEEKDAEMSKWDDMYDMMIDSSDSDSDKTEDDDDQVSQSSSSDEFTH